MRETTIILMLGKRKNQIYMEIRSEILLDRHYKVSLT